MNIFSWNVNGIRACIKKGFFQFLNDYDPDILCLQEMKAPIDVLDEVLAPCLDNYHLYHSVAQKKGYSGVTTLIKKQILAPPTKSLGMAKFDSEGRTLIHDLENFILLNCYFPNSQRDHARLPYKLEFCQAIAKFMKSQSKPVILTGDTNIAHRPIDLKNPKTNEKSAGFLPEERAWMDVMTKDRFLDIFRKRYPNKEGQYTWWTYRQGCREKNIGWRIDSFLISKEIENSIIDAPLHPSILGSDHCPIELKLKDNL